jgi:hypothetical protein
MRSSLNDTDADHRPRVSGLSEIIIVTEWNVDPEKFSIRSAQFLVVRNLDAPCNMTAVMQQLFDVGRFRDAILERQFAKEHSEVFQLLFCRCSGQSINSPSDSNFGESGQIQETRSFVVIYWTNYREIATACFGTHMCID